MARSAHPDPNAPLQDGKAGKLWDMIRHIRVAMMTTIDGGLLRARPMWTQQDAFQGELYFLTRLSAHKVDELQANPQVGLCFADPDGQNYVSVSGAARLTQEHAAIGRHWKEPMRTWFPQGKDDPDLALLVVTVEQAEYWDSPSSTMVHLYGYAKAVLTGSPPHPGDNQKVGFRP